MANNYQQGCESWPITDIEKGILLSLYDNPQDWVELPDELDPDDPDRGFVLEFGTNYNENSKVNHPHIMLITDDGEWFNSTNVANFLASFMKRCRPKEALGFTWSNTCSKSRPGEFGGGACVVYGDGHSEWLDAGMWIMRKINEHDEKQDQLNKPS